MDYKINIEKKKIKNIYIKIEDDGSVTVRANKKLSDKDINKVINSKRKWIEKNLSKGYTDKTSISSFDKETLLFLGDEYKICIVNLDTNNIYFMGETIVIETTEKNLDIISNMINIFIKKEFMNILMTEYIPEAKEKAKSAGINVHSRFRLRLMKSRFGSYSSKTNAVTLNLSLAKYDKKIIMSVIYHEIAHIKEMNHGKKFYNELYKMMPEYKVVSKRLKENFRYDKYWFIKE